MTSENMDASVISINLKGPAANFVLSSISVEANSSDDDFLPENLSIAIAILDEIYKAVWSRECFVQDFVTVNSFQLRVVARHQDASFRLLTDCHTKLLLSKINNRVLEIEENFGITLQLFEELLVAEMKVVSLAYDQYDDLMNRSQVKMVKINNHDLSALERDNQSISNVENNIQTAPNVDETQSPQTNAITEISAENVFFDSQIYHQVDAKQTDVDVEALGKTLQERLQSKAKICSGYIPSPVPVKRKYEVAKLELERNPQQITRDYEYEISFLRRDSVVDLYSRSSGNLEINAIFKEAHENAVKEAETTCKSHEARQSYIQQHGNIVGVIGQAGIGKTTFTKILIQHILSGQFPCQVSFLFYVFVRDIDFSKKCNVLQFLISSSIPDWEHSPESDKALLKKICQDKQVMVVIDGFDEAKFSHEKFTKIKLTDESAPLLVLLNLMSGDILPLAKRVITSRPQSIYNLNPQQRPHFIAQIIGLSRESQDILGHQICGESYKELKSMMYKNPDISLYWYVPIYCIMSCSYFANRNEAESLSFTMTSLLTATFVDYASTEHLRGKETELEKLSELAWFGAKSQKCVFTVEELQRVGLDPNTVQAFLQVALTMGLHLNMSILQGHQLTFFSHLIWQEYFAAIYLFILGSPRQYTQLYNDSNVIQKFLFGLCNRKVFCQLHAVMPIPASRWNVVKRELTRCIRHMSKGVLSLDKLLLVASLLLEAQDDSMLIAIVDNIDHKKSIKLSGPLLPSDIVALCYLFKGMQNLHKGIEKIIVEANTGVADVENMFSESALDRLLREISLGIQIKHLVLSGTKLDSGQITFVSTCLRFVDHLHIEKCKITHDTLPPITDKLLNEESSLTELRLSGNRIGDIGTHLLAPCLSNLQSLYLGDCGMTSNGVKSLCDALLNIPQQIDYLNLSGNMIGNEGAAFLSTCLHKIKQLCLLLCQITALGSVTVGSKLKELDEPMELLDLSENVIGEEGTNALCQCQGKIKKILLLFCDLTREQCKKLHIQTSQNQLQTEDAETPIVRVHNLLTLIQYNDDYDY